MIQESGRWRPGGFSSVFYVQLLRKWEDEEVTLAGVRYRQQPPTLNKSRLSHRPRLLSNQGGQKKSFAWEGKEWEGSEGKHRWLVRNETAARGGVCPAGCRQRASSFSTTERGQLLLGFLRPAPLMGKGNPARATQPGASAVKSPGERRRLSSVCPEKRLFLAPNHLWRPSRSQRSPPPASGQSRKAAAALLRLNVLRGLRRLCATPRRLKRQALGRDRFKGVSPGRAAPRRGLGGKERPAARSAVGSGRK